MGIPLAVVLAPLFLLIALLTTDLVNLVVPVGDPSNAVDGFATNGGRSMSPALVAGLVAVALVPGVLAHLLAWLAVRRLFARAGEGAALALGARGSRPDDLEERQLVNVVEEVAIAGGIPPPKVLLIDAQVMNAAIVGGDVDDAALVVTTGLLATLDRDETQAVLAVAVGSAGNGDLGIGTTIASVEQTTGLMATVLSAPSSAGARGALRRLVRLTIEPGGDRERAAAELAALFAYTDQEDDEGRRSRLLRVVLMPVALAGGVYSLARTFYSSLLVEPVLRRGWRARKRLADATAVELNRNPDALARALVKMAGHADLLPGSAWASHLFVVGPEAVMAQNLAVLQQKLAGGDGNTAGLGLLSDPEALTAFAAMAEVAQAATYHPPIGDRIVALRTLGASVDPAGLPTSPRRSPIRKALGVLALPFRLVAWVFQLLVPVFAMAVALFLGLIYVLPVAALVHHLLRSWA